MFSTHSGAHDDIELIREEHMDFLYYTLNHVIVFIGDHYHFAMTFKAIVVFLLVVFTMELRSS